MTLRHAAWGQWLASRNSAVNVSSSNNNLTKLAGKENGKGQERTEIIQYQTDEIRK